jgi:hypothetical protein
MEFNLLIRALVSEQVFAKHAVNISLFAYFFYLPALSMCVPEKIQGQGEGNHEHRRGHQVDSH